MPNGFGSDIETDSDIRKDAFLFGEGQSRAVVSVSPADQERFVELMSASEIDYSLLGTVTANDLMTVDAESLGNVSEAKKRYHTALSTKMSA